MAMYKTSNKRHARGLVPLDREEYIGGRVERPSRRYPDEIHPSGSDMPELQRQKSWSRRVPHSHMIDHYPSNREDMAAEYKENVLPHDMESTPTHSKKDQKKGFDETPIFRRYQAKLSRSASTRTLVRKKDDGYSKLRNTRSDRKAPQVTPSPPKYSKVYRRDPLKNHVAYLRDRIADMEEARNVGFSEHTSRVLAQAAEALSFSEAVEREYRSNYMHQPLSEHDVRPQSQSASYGDDVYSPERGNNPRSSTSTRSRSRNTLHDTPEDERVFLERSQTPSNHSLNRRSRREVVEVSTRRQGKGDTIPSQPDSLLKLALLTKKSEIQAGEPVRARTPSRKGRRSRSLPNGGKQKSEPKESRTILSHGSHPHEPETPEQQFEKRVELALNDYTPSRPFDKDFSMEWNAKSNPFRPFTETPKTRSELTENVNPRTDVAFDPVEIELESPIPVIVERKTSSKHQRKGRTAAKQGKERKNKGEHNGYKRVPGKDISPVATIHVREHVDNADEDLTVSVVPISLLPLQGNRSLSPIETSPASSSVESEIRSSVDLVESSFSTLSTSVYDITEVQRRKGLQKKTLLGRILQGNNEKTPQTSQPCTGIEYSKPVCVSPEPKSQEERGPVDSLRMDDPTSMSFLTDRNDYQQKISASIMASAVGKLIQSRFRTGKARSERQHRHSRSNPLSGSPTSSDQAVRSPKERKPVMGGPGEKKYLVDNEAPRRRCFDLFANNNSSPRDQYDWQVLSHGSPAARHLLHKEESSSFISRSNRSSPRTSLSPETVYDLPTYFPRNYPSPIQG